MLLITQTSHRFANIQAFTVAYLQATSNGIQTAAEKFIGNASASLWTSTEGGNTPIMLDGSWVDNDFTEGVQNAMLSSFIKIISYKSIK